jgi:hypothetical protein
MPPTVRIGNKIVLHSGLLILNDDEPALIEIRLPLGAAIYTDAIKIELRCPPTPDALTKFAWKTVGDVVKFELSGFKSNQWGVVLPEPAQFGFQNGRPLFFQFAYTRVSEKNIVQFMVLQQEPKP